jgi:hypothetical protein
MPANGRIEDATDSNPHSSHNYQRGIAMPTVPPLQTTYIHAVEYARLFLEMIDHTFPGQKYITLTEEQCRMVRNATDNLLTVSKWRVESSQFSSTFEVLPPPHLESRPDGAGPGVGTATP